MGDRFDYFVVLANMRTGSNFLEASLSEYDGLTCHGELFNPNFIGSAGCLERDGLTIEARDADPIVLLKTLRGKGDSLAGFRLFQDHSPRVLTTVLDNPCAAKIILSRNPLDSYVSLKIARATGQWRLGDRSRAKRATIDFDAGEFAEFLGRLTEHHRTLTNALQVRGQTAFHVAYDDLGNVDVLNGLARWLGSKDQKSRVSQKTKVQNPAPLSDKVRNFEEMTRALSDIDKFGLFDTPLSEPRRSSNIPRYIGGQKAAILFMPLPGGPSEAIANWLARADSGDLITGFTQKTLRQWMRKRPGHRSFTVLRHPLARAHHMFSTRILPVSDCTFLAIRDLLRGRYKMNLPDQTPGSDWGRDQHHSAFLIFLKFLKDNLSGQTDARIDPGWSSQVELIRGFSDFGPPDILIREDQISVGLDRLATDVGLNSPEYSPEMPDTPWSLDQIWSADLEQACREVFARDYLVFGWSDWANET